LFDKDGLFSLASDQLFGVMRFLVANKVNFGESPFYIDLVFFSHSPQ